MGQGVILAALLACGHDRAPPTAVASPAVVSPAVASPAVGSPPNAAAAAPARTAEPFPTAVLHGTLSRTVTSGGENYRLVTCEGPALTLLGDASTALTGLGESPWQVIVSAGTCASCSGMLVIREMAYASPAGDVCGMTTPMARGSEPGWSAAFGATGLTFQSADQGPAGRLLPLADLALEDKPCHDGAAGAWYHKTASITVGATVYRGCGVALATTPAE